MAQETIQLYCEECPSCHLLFWMSQDHHNRLVSSKKSFYCPNGHSQSYTGKTDKQKLIEAEDMVGRLRKNWDDCCETSNQYYESLQKVKKELKELKKPQEKKKLRNSKQGGRE